MHFLFKVIAVLVSLALFIGCTKEVIPEPGPKDVVYKFTDFTPEGFNYDILVGLAHVGDTVYMLTQKTEAIEGDGSVESFYLLKTNAAGEVIEKKLLASATEEQTLAVGYKYYMGLAVEGNDIYLIRQTWLSKPSPRTELTTYSVNEDGSYKVESGNKVEQEEPKTLTEIVRSDGYTETALVDLTGALDPLVTDIATIFVSDFEVDKKDVAYVTVNTNMVYAIDLSTGKILFENKATPQGGSVRGFFKNDKGEVCIVSFKQMEKNGEKINKLIIDPINPKTGDFGKEERFDAPSGNYTNLSPGDEKYTYYGFSSNSIYGYKKGERILVADLPASGVPLSEITRVIAVSDTEFLITGYTLETTGLEKLYKLTKVDPKDVPDKSIIKVAAVAEPIYFEDYMKEFSLTHPQYQVEYKQYAVDSKTTFDEALTAFNNDIIAGNIPDVIVIEPEMPYANYVRKGLIADLYPYIDNDADYSREDFLQPLLKAFETDGKLYSIAPAFDITTLVGKTSIFGEAQSFAEFQSIAHREGASLFGTAITRDVFSEIILTKMASGFIDDKNGVCSFDCPEFIALLEYAKSLPSSSVPIDTIDKVGKQEVLSDAAFNFAPGETADYRTDKTLIELMSVYDFRHIVSLEKVEFGEPVTFLGLGDGIEARPTLETAVMADAQNPTGAWEFVKGLFSYGNHWIEILGYPPLGVFPSLMSELDIAAEKATIPPYETWYGERMARRNWIGADLSNQPDNTVADNAKMFALFDSIDGIARSVPAIEKIIAEETSAYFAGNKTAEETAGIIQNRATTYLEETRG
jgi:ABC-type glycerol-3-phosphate transport system substrate-binding protein